jgi:hypothetical protein
VAFPIEDTLLLIYTELFDPEKKVVFRLSKIPEPMDDKLIPPGHLGDILLIYNFVMTFIDEFEFPFPLNKDLIYQALVSHLVTQSLAGGDKVFYRILNFLIEIYLRDIL